MENLEFRIGGINIVEGKFTAEIPEFALHIFTICAMGNSVAIYISADERHCAVADRFKAEGERVGGGSCYINKNNFLSLCDFSGDFGSIPKSAAKKFAELLKPVLIELGHKINGISAEPNNDTEVNNYWIEKDRYP